MKLRAQRNGPPCSAVLLLLDVPFVAMHVLDRRAKGAYGSRHIHSRWLPITLSSGSSDGLSLPLRDFGQPRALSTDALGLLLGSKSVTALVVMLIESAAELAEHLRAEADRYAAILAFEPEKSITCVSVPGHG